MKAIQISRTGNPDVLDLVDLPTPSPGPGEVVLPCPGEVVLAAPGLPVAPVPTLLDVSLLFPWL